MKLFLGSLPTVSAQTPVSPHGLVVHSALKRATKKMTPILRILLIFGLAAPTIDALPLYGQFTPYGPVFIITIESHMW